jgi:putative component of membrane protein insertase Oxa1/YidC/SpoIIIJ protein YidD
MLSRMLRMLLIFLIRHLRPFFGPPGLCISNPVCTKFAYDQLTTEPLLKAVFAITRRFFRCTPFGFQQTKKMWSLFAKVLRQHPHNNQEKSFHHQRIREKLS